ncbi:12117_t:CDS:2 [Dentiscutata heterogama]|uniref:12117_t:CDS:1 n=1 Tax=Dentiscutata heterogama TaxID=1316150 RepID=A0ACA9L453_9GLOM|nr:12117_t:CDS:2 [Dentiscutata heterogama]
MWQIEEIQLLVNERKRRNAEFHQTFKKNAFWQSVANRVNDRFNTSYTSKHCKDKFSQLVKEFNQMRKYRAGDAGSSSLLGRLFFEEFKTFFWKRPKRELNSSRNRRQQQLVFPGPQPQPQSGPSSPSTNTSGYKSLHLT